MKPRAQREGLSRREFIVSAAAIAASASVPTFRAAADSSTEPINIDIVPNYHPASCGWLVDFSRERVYCANNYLLHLDRVRDDPNYCFALSEANNVIAIKDFHPERMAELKQRIDEGRVEIVNAFFLESTINLSGGEALVRLGVEGIRWFEQILGVRPRFCWNIDACGEHEQMAQIARGLDLDAIVFTRSNPTDKAIFWTVSPDGSRILTMVPGSYSRAKIVFRTQSPLTQAQLDTLEEEFAKKQAETPPGIPGLVLGGSGDYSRAPLFTAYPAEFLREWQEHERRKVRFTTLSGYFDSVRPAVVSGAVRLPEHRGGTAYDYGAWWIENARVKTSFRRLEHKLRAAEALSTVVSATSALVYPSQDLYNCWILMFLNMDRDTLWGGAAGPVYESETSWDVEDRFRWVDATTERALSAASGSLTDSGEATVLFNSLNWSFCAPLRLTLPVGKSVAGAPCEAMPDGRVLTNFEIPAMSFANLKLKDAPAQLPKAIGGPSMQIETRFHLMTMDKASGGVASLKSKATGREFLRGPANIIFSERPLERPDEPGDHMPPTREQRVIASSSNGSSSISVRNGPVSTEVEVTGTFEGAALKRTLRLYHEHPRIDVEVELNDIPDYTVIYAAVPLADRIHEVRRGIPYGFSHAAWSVPNPELGGWAKGIVPAIRWIDYELESGGGFAIFDRGLTGRELNGSTPLVYLMNAEDTYWAYPSPWTSGKGKHVLEYALLPHDEPWIEARVPQAAWEYNQEPVQLAFGGKEVDERFLETSGNVIVEAMRRVDDWIEVRLVECFGREE